MKRILVILSLVSFIAVNVSVAQEPQASTTETKKEAVAKSDAKDVKASGFGCCSKSGSMKGSSSSKMKNCSAAEKAACVKGDKAKASCDHGDKAKAEAGTETEKKDGAKANNN